MPSGRANYIVPSHSTYQPRGIALVGGNRRNKNGNWIVPLAYNQPIMNMRPPPRTIAPVRPLLTTITREQLEQIEGPNYMRFPPPRQPKMVLELVYIPLGDTSATHSQGEAAPQWQQGPQEQRGQRNGAVQQNRRRAILVPPRTNRGTVTAEEKEEMRQEQIDQGLLLTDHSSDETDDEYIGPRTKEEFQALREESRRCKRQLVREGKRTYDYNAKARQFAYRIHPETGERMWYRVPPRIYSEAEKAEIDKDYSPDRDLENLWSSDEDALGPVVYTTVSDQYVTGSPEEKMRKLIISNGQNANQDATSNDMKALGDGDSDAHDMVIRDSRKQTASKSK